MEKESSCRKAPHEEVLASLLDMYQARDWQQFHSPKNLVMDLGSEVGELLDLFRWMSEEQSFHPDEKTLQDIRDEIADVFKAILYLAHRLGIDPIEAAYQKLEKIKQKYPIEQSKGKALKYTAYEMKQVKGGPLKENYHLIDWEEIQKNKRFFCLNL